MFHLFDQIFFANNYLTLKWRAGCIYSVFPLTNQLCKLKFSVKLNFGWLCVLIGFSLSLEVFTNIFLTGSPRTL